MDTLIVKIGDRNKAQALLSFLREMDFVVSADFAQNVYAQARELLRQTNLEAGKTTLPELTEEDINEEIAKYRRGE